MIARTTALLALASSLGCSTPSPAPAPLGTALSSDFRTSELFLAATVDSNGSEVLVTDLELRGPSGFELGGGDKLLVGEHGSPESRVDASEGFALVPGQVDAIDIVLERKGGVTATTVVHLAPGFALEPPPSPISRSAAITVSWTPVDPAALYATAVSITSPCFSPIGRKLSVDTGTISLQPADLSPKPGPCDITFRVARGRDDADVAPELDAKKTKIHSAQLRTITLATGP
jgi:hypothetical protein